jgi:sec-independent protein translocase protein TatA
MFGLGATEIILIVAVLFLLFGATRLPQLAKSLGQSRKAFRDGMKEAEEEARLEEEQKKLGAVQNPQISSVTDEELLSELRNRAEAKH